MQTTRSFPRALAGSGNALTVVVKDLLSDWSHLRLLTPREKSSTGICMEGIISIYRGHKGLGFFQRAGNNIVQDSNSLANSCIPLVKTANAGLNKMFIVAYEVSLYT